MIQQFIKLPINLSLGIGAYTSRLFIGSEAVEVNVLLDTGSSTLAIDLNKYQPENDSHLETTTYAQDVVYGSGGWAGPVIRTQIELNHDEQLKLEKAPMAITSVSQQSNFQHADGIWGLAYHHLNKAYDVTALLKSQEPPVKSTYPWPFDLGNDPSAIADFKKKLRSFPEQDITPLFTAFEENNVIPDQFTLVTKRSIVYVPRDGMSTAEIADEKLNQGEFIIGQFKPHQTRQSIKVFHDAYYNTHLQAIRVEGFEPCIAPPLDDKHQHNFFTNAIIDSGCSYVILQKVLYNYLTQCLKQLNPDFINCIESFQQALKAQNTYQNAALNPSQWPNVFLMFSGINNKKTELIIKPSQYWQDHSTGPNNWHFMFMNQLPQWPEQSIFGLPLLNNYCCVFDRSKGNNGQIHWIEQENS